jgi:hypothetical protein
MSKKKDECRKCGAKIPLMQFLDHKRRRADDLFLHAGNHEKLKMANRLIEEAREIETEVRELQARHRRRLKPEYSRKITMAKSTGDGWTNVPEGQEYFTILSELVNGDLFDKHIKKYGSLSQSPDVSHRSVRYYRKHGFLFHDGGGHHILEDEQPCSDEDWEQFRDGNIPEVFKRR